MVRRSLLVSSVAASQLSAHKWSGLNMLLLLFAGCSFTSTFLHNIPRVLSLESIQNLAVISEPGFGYAPTISRYVTLHNMCF